MPRPLLIILLGPTGVGKTELSIRLAQYVNSPVLSVDSRQIFRELPIGTAAATQEHRALVSHHFVGTHSITQTYSAAQYEADALDILSQHYNSGHRCAIATGGSMMYIDALVRGIDFIPDVDPEVRSAVWQRYENEGLEGIASELRQLDPTYYAKVDPHNYKRILHAYEVCLSSGKPFSSYHTNSLKSRPFDVLKIGLTRPREELYHRINLRVLQMMAQGLEQEARSVYTSRHLNALNTVGYKELFSYFDGTISLEEAIRQIQRNTRIYARKQLTWWKRDESIHWFHPSNEELILRLVSSSLP